MKKKYIVIVLIFVAFLILTLNNKSYAADLDEIVNYVVTVEPRMNDGTLDITYEITWKVLDSTTEGPLEWVQIGTPNSNFDTPTALTKNIKSITRYSGSPYVKIVFNKAYYAGEQLTFKYKIHQSYMYKISWGKCKYSFTPAWFTNAKIHNMTVKWNKDGVKSSNSKSKEDNYLVWNKTNMVKGEKLTVDVKYDKSAFSSLNENKQRTNNNATTIYVGMIILFGFSIMIFVYAMICIFSRGGGYYGHGGFYGGYGYRHYGPRYHGGGCVRSSCACAHSSCASSCACACAGSGRAGCSKKDFYGIIINKNKLTKALK